VPYRPDKRDKKQVVSSHEGTKGTKVFLGGRAGRKSQVAGRESTTLIATTQWLAILRVKALLCFLEPPRRQERQGVGEGAAQFFSRRERKDRKGFWGHAPPSVNAERRTQNAEVKIPNLKSQARAPRGKGESPIFMKFHVFHG
jgi:hypothetical protein